MERAISRAQFRFGVTLLALVLASACGGNEEQKPAGASAGPPSVAPGRRSTRVGDGAREKELERIEAAIEGDLAAGAWTRAGGRIPQALRQAEQGGRDFEGHKARLLYAYGELMQETGNEVEARRRYAEAMALFEYRNDAEGRCRTSLALGRLEVRLGDYAAAARRYEAAEALLPEVKDRRLPALLRIAAGQLASRQVKHDLAGEQLGQALRIFEEIKDRQGVADTLLLLAREQDAVGQTGAGRRSLERAAGIFRELKNLDGQARAQHRLALLAQQDGNVKGARRLLLEVQDLYDKLDRRSARDAVAREISALPEEK